MGYKEFKYIKDGERFIFCEGDEWIGDPNVYELYFMVDVADLDQNMCTLLKHGKKELVEKKYNAYISSLKAGGLDDMIKDVMMIDVSKLELDEINKCITNSGYISKIVKALKDGEEQS